VFGILVVCGCWLDWLGFFYVFFFLFLGGVISWVFVFVWGWCFGFVVMGVDFFKLLGFYVWGVGLGSRKVEEGKPESS